jgi:MFS family permease
MALVLFTTWITVLKIKRKNSILSTESITDTIHEAFDQPPLHICDKDSLVWRRISNSIVGCISAAKDPKIILGSCGNLLARSDSVSITLFLPLWVYKYYLDNNLCQIGDLNSPDFNTICRNAYVRASVLSGVTQVFALVGAPLFGYFADKFYRPIVVLFAALSAGTGYLLLAFTSNIQSNIVFAYLFLIGFGEIGLIVTSLGLVTHSSVPEHARGSVAGLASFCGALGILISSKVGGYLFDVWFLGGAFALLGMLHLLFLVVGTLAVFLEARNHGGFTMDSFRKMRAVFQE